MDFFFFKQKTAYEMRISDWSSDVCSSDLIGGVTDLYAFLLRMFYIDGIVAHALTADHLQVRQLVDQVGASGSHGAGDQYSNLVLSGLDHSLRIWLIPKFDDIEMLAQALLGMRKREGQKLQQGGFL